MRDILDPIDPANLRAPFREVFRRLQRGQVLKRFVYLDGHYLLSLDGTTQQFPACGFRPENTLVLISHFANSLRTMLSRIPYLTAWANGVTRHGTCFR